MESRPKPKRPLSAFNLYFRYKRTIILEETQQHTYDEKSETVSSSSSSSSTNGSSNNNSNNNNKNNKENIQRLITSTPGLESYTHETLSTLSPAQRREISRTKIRRVLVNNLSPNESTRDRLHRKTHGCMSFTEMSKIMSTSWKSIDEYSKSVFEELAKEGRTVQQERVAEYKKLMNPPHHHPEAMTSSSSSDGLTGELGQGGHEQQQLYINFVNNLNHQHHHPPFLIGNYNQYNQYKMTGVDTPSSNNMSPASSHQGSSSSFKSTNKKSSSKKKRSSSSSANKKLPTTTRPKRPLSAYNLFYRYKRMKILKAYNNSNTCSTGPHDDDDSKKKKKKKEDIIKLLERMPGLEDYPNIIEYNNDPTTKEDLPQYVKDICSTEIHSILQDNLSPNDTQHDRLHRKSSHGCNIVLSFTELSKIMCDSWKTIDEYTKSIFEELAKKGREMNQLRLVEYERLNQPGIVKRQRLNDYAARAIKISPVPQPSTHQQQQIIEAQQVNTS